MCLSSVIAALTQPHTRTVEYFLDQRKYASLGGFRLNDGRKMKHLKPIGEEWAPVIWQASTMAEGPPDSCGDEAGQADQHQV